MTETSKAAGWVVQFSFPQPVTNKFGAGPPKVEFYNVAIEAPAKAIDAAIAKRQSTQEDTEAFVVRPLSSKEIEFLKLGRDEIKPA